MKFTVNSNQPEKKLVAVLGENGNGLFVRNSNGGTSYFSRAGNNSSSLNYTLESCLKSTVTRTPVYAGDTVTIEF